MLTIKVEGHIGSSPEVCAKEILELAKKLNVFVDLDFNGYKMFCGPMETEEMILERFHMASPKK